MKFPRFDCFYLSSLKKPKAKNIVHTKPESYALYLGTTLTVHQDWTGVDGSTGTIEVMFTPTSISEHTGVTTELQLKYIGGQYSGENTL